MPDQRDKGKLEYNLDPEPHALMIIPRHAAADVRQQAGWTSQCDHDEGVQIASQLKAPYSLFIVSSPSHQ
ncbi:hypothetical protein CBOM_07588 [Ceraceosorus bombacis]|uniref:Uncharacterized protein n=1 Tax=Ceraceosorus bombacis TaxID=401625 RepID=A0A0P1B9H0_9BASI|nr:hypothetical protein CBOM_07588 [Ceraceosorus bombacis]